MSMEKEQKSCRLGRPREFDIGAALDAALGVFWRAGYEGASLTDLTAAMGINRPSLYAAFGSKEELFRRAMDRYTERAMLSFEPCHAEPTARAFIECILRTSVDGATDCRRPAGCFLVQGALTCGDAAKTLRHEAAERRIATRGMLLKRFEHAAAAGELPADTDTAALADFYATVLQGIALQAVNGVDRLRLHRTVDLALRAWPASAQPKKKAKLPARPARS